MTDQVTLIEVITQHGPLAAVCAWLLWERRDVTNAIREHSKVLQQLRILILERLEK